VSTRGGWQLALLIALACALTVGTAGWGSLYNETDGQYGGAAKVMVRNGSWLIPENDGIPRLVKPPLLYWALAASMKLFGVNEFAARLPNALAVVAWVAITFLIGREMGGISRGLLAGIVLLTSLGTFTLGRIVMPEPMFSALIAAALYCVLRGVDDAAWRAAWFLGFWVFASLASFTKGWHGLLYPLVIVGVAALFSRENRISLRGLISRKGALLFLLINLPWYIYVELRFPGYLHNLLVAEQLGHVIGASTPATHYANVPRLQFLLLQLAWLFPWSLAILAALPIATGSVLHRWRLPTSFPSLVISAWFAVILGSVLIVGQRQDYYAMAMWPTVALTVAWLMERLRIQSLLATSALLFAVVLAVANSMPSIAEDPASVALVERATAWATLASFERTIWAALQTTAWLSLGGAVLCVLFGLFRWRPTIKVGAIVASAVCLDLGAVSGTALVSPYFSLATVAADISERTPIVYDGGIDTASSLLFYSDSPVILLDQDPNDDFVVRTFGIGRDRYLTSSEFVAFWKSASRTVFITDESKLAGWQEVLGMALDPAAQSGTQILVKKTP
jgi:4-amino-4-deoxy-L-arabinose transferase-like glycosyltransferase